MSTTMMFIHGARPTPAVIAFKSFPGRSRFLCAEPGWEEVAVYAIMWASQHAMARKTKIAGERIPDLAHVFFER